MNVETVLHELIADKNATIPQICARTGMALRTINNALATLRGAGILKARGDEGNGLAGDGDKEGDKKPHIRGEKPSIGSQKPSIGGEELHIGMEKLHIESALMKLDITQPTKENILKLIQRFGTVEIFGRSEVCKATGLQERAASYLIGTMLRHRLLDTVKGHGKGKYRFRATVWTGEYE